MLDTNLICFSSPATSGIGSNLHILWPGGKGKLNLQLGGGSSIVSPSQPASGNGAITLVTSLEPKSTWQIWYGEVDPMQGLQEIVDFDFPEGVLEFTVSAGPDSYTQLIVSLIKV